MKLFFLAVFMTVLSTSALARMVERMPDQPGSVDTYVSDNGKYEVSIMYGKNFPSWSLKENDQVLWSKPLMNEPGAAAISDNGEAITLPLWGWRDEGGSSGVAVYNIKGELLREVHFNGELPGTESLRWVHETRISPDGKYFIIGENGKECSYVTLFNARTGEIVWGKKVGLSEMVQVKVSKDGKYALVTTNEYKDRRMEFQLLDSSGIEIWHKKMAHNFSYEVKHYVKFTDDGSGFQIYDLKSGKYISEKIPTVKVH